MHSPPKKPIKDNVTGETLIRRSAEASQRLLLHAQTIPVIDYCKKKGLWHLIDAAQAPSIVWDNLHKLFTRQPS
jgi:adenylate kinase